MNVIITRFETSDQGTFGFLYVDGSHEPLCVTGELPVNGGNPDVQNERQVDCIPEGTYTCQIRQSEKFGKVYEIKDVPGRSDVLIHRGNYCGDKAKGHRSDVQGCIFLGSDLGELEGQKAVIRSKAAYAKFMELAGGEPFELTIEWAE